MIFGAAPSIDGNKVQELAKECFLIAADGGLKHILSLGLKPDLLIGDFDSINRPVEQQCETIVLPAEKDDTDTIAAIRLAVERGFQEIYLAGGTGGRLDHTIANLTALAWTVERGIRAYLLSGEGIIFCIRDTSVQVPKGNTRYLSVFAWNGTAEGVNLSGVKYPLHNATLTSTFPLGVSNEILGESAEISVSKGMLLIMTV